MRKEEKTEIPGTTIIRERHTIGMISQVLCLFLLVGSLSISDGSPVAAKREVKFEDDKKSSNNPEGG